MIRLSLTCTFTVDLPAIPWRRKQTNKHLKNRGIYRENVFEYWQTWPNHTKQGYGRSQPLLVELGWYHLWFCAIPLIFSQF